MSDVPWDRLTADEKRTSRVALWREPGVEFASDEAKAEYQARLDRIIAALELRQPDRVPVCLNIGYWPATLAGMTAREAMTDPWRAGQAWVDFNLRFEPDGAVPPLPGANSSQMLEALDYKLYSWPGHGVPDDASFQYNEKEWMRADEYDHLISDFSDFMLRVYLPRAVGAFSAFEGISSLLDFTELPFVWSHVAGWNTEAMAQGLERLAAAARAVGEWMPATFTTFGKLSALGFPGYYQAMCKAPFDTLSDTLRGTRGMMVDMYRQPEIIDEGMIPLCFAEGRFNSRLEAIMDLPPGKTAWVFDQTDMGRAKETIGTIACIQGNVPLSLMHAGTPDEVAAYTRQLIDTAGAGGGYILDFGASPDDGPPENLHAMIETAKTHGVY